MDDKESEKIANAVAEKIRRRDMIKLKLNTDHEIFTRLLALFRFSKRMEDPDLFQEFTREISEIEQEFKKSVQRRWSYIMLHHSLTQDGQTVSWDAIRRWHMGMHPDSPYQNKPMDDIGYHYGIELVDYHYEVMVGRDLDQDGAHCFQGGMNHKAIGICFVGNFDLAPPPAAQWERGLRFVASLMRILDIPVVVAHRDFNPGKSCPGKFFNMDLFRQGLAL